MIAGINHRQNETESTVNMTGLSKYMHFDAGGGGAQCVSKEALRSSAVMTGSTWFEDVEEADLALRTSYVECT